MSSPVTVPAAATQKSASSSKERRMAMRASVRDVDLLKRFAALTELSRDSGEQSDQAAITRDIALIRARLDEIESAHELKPPVPPMKRTVIPVDDAGRPVLAVPFRVYSSSAHLKVPDTETSDKRNGVRLANHNVGPEYRVVIMGSGFLRVKQGVPALTTQQKIVNSLLKCEPVQTSEIACVWAIGDEGENGVTDVYLKLMPAVTRVPGDELR